MMQSVVEGPSYFTNTWNVVRVASCAFFWMGVHVVLAHEAMCIEEPSKCKKEKEVEIEEDPMSEDDYYYYYRQYDY